MIYFFKKRMYHISIMKSSINVLWNKRPVAFILVAVYFYLPKASLSSRVCGKGAPTVSGKNNEHTTEMQATTPNIISGSDSWSFPWG